MGLKESVVTVGLFNAVKMWMVRHPEVLQKDLAKRLGVSPKTLERFAPGACQSDVFLLALCELVGYPFERLLDEQHKLDAEFAKN